MDDDDRQEVEDHLNTIDKNVHNTIENLNSQVRINRNFNETLMKLKKIIEDDRMVLTGKINEIQDYNDILYKRTIYIDFVLKLKILQDNIEQLQDNIASAKSGIIHSNILTNEEIEEYNIDFQKLQNIKLGTVIDNNKNIIFIVRIPKEMIIAQKTMLIPIGDNQHKELLFEPQEIVKYENKTYNYIKSKDLKNLKICNICVLKKNCMKIFNNVSEIIELEQGMIVAKNQKKTNFSSTCDERKLILDGNYFINFNNCSIKIDDKIFQNNHKEFKQRFTIQNNLENIENSNKKLLFDDIILEQVENIKEIKEIKFQKKTNYVLGSMISIIILIIVIIIVIFTLKHKGLKIKINMKTQESLQSKKGGVTSVTSNKLNSQQYCCPQQCFYNYQI